MIRLIVFLAIVIALSLFATWLADHPGRAALTWGDTHVETSVVVLAVGMLLIGILLVILFEIYRLIRGAPRRWRNPRPSCSAPRPPSWKATRGPPE